MAYSDINPINSLQNPLLEGVDAVLEALTNIFSTDQDERLFNLNITANLKDLLFEPLTPNIASVVFSRITYAIERFEPRASVISNMSSVTVNTSEDGYDVNFAIKIRGYENAQNLRFILPRIK